MLALAQVLGMGALLFTEEYPESDDVG